MGIDLTYYSAGALLALQGRCGLSIWDRRRGNLSDADGGGIRSEDSVGVNFCGQVTEYGLLQIEILGDGL